MDEDIARLEQMEGRLPDPELSRALSTALFESAPDGLVIVEIGSFTIRFINRAAEFIFGYHRTELVGKPIDVLIPEQYRDRHSHDAAEYATNPRPRPMGFGQMLAGRHKSGQDVPAYIMLSPVSVPEGQFVLATVRPHAAPPKGRGHGEIVNT
jgi:PAS domain S-box-containing protein